MALRHYAGALHYSDSANRDGMHTIALGLARHAVEALTVVELALPCSGDSGLELLRRWRDGAASFGQLRAALERDTWIHYGSGLWGESWSDFFANLCKALQPYAHCTSSLVEWSYWVWPDAGDGSTYAVPGHYDPLKASRITLLHALLTWTNGRLLAQSGERIPDVVKLGDALAHSNLLFENRTDWSVQFAPHMSFHDDGNWDGSVEQAHPADAHEVD
jgi:hypothetical protein